MNRAAASTSFSWRDLHMPPGQNLRLLIEASAGTGKTYTLERIVVHYLVNRRLSLSSMLVVTFTRKATRELRTRLRTLLTRLLDDQLFAGELLAEIGLQSSRIGDWQSHVAAELRNFHHADIHTIHGFAKAALDRHPAESGSLAGQRIDNACLGEIIHDQLLSTLVSGSVEINFGGGYEKPDSLPSAKSALTGPDLDFCLDRTYESLSCKSAADLVDILQEMQEKGIFNPIGMKFGLNDATNPEALWYCLFNKHWTACQALFQNDTAAASNQADPLAIEALRTELGPYLPELDLAKDDNLQDAVSRICAFSLARWLLVALDDYRQRQVRFLDRMGHNDLLVRLDRACVDDSLLLQQLRQEYRLILIDEFQDTDALQWRIFSRLAQDADLIAVGDPKQAIYAFRGADLNTYLRARAELGHTRVLDRNFRSGDRLIGGLNRLFEHSFQPSQVGATARLDYQAVTAGRADPGEQELVSPNGLAYDPIQAINFNLPDQEGKNPKTADFKRHCLDALVQTIQQLLAGGTLYRISAKEIRQLSAGDLTILCATGSDCRMVRDRLIESSVNASLAGQGRLLASQEAAELQILLDALANPTDPALVRAAALTRFFGLDPVSIRSQDGGMEQVMEQLTTWHRGFDRLGLSGIHAWIEPILRPRLLDRQGHGALRTLTNLQHIVELFLDNLTGRQVSALAIGQEFRNFRHESSLQEEIPLRRDSDAPAVRIMTMHSSKGLEFPVVFLYGNFAKAEPRPGAIWYELDTNTAHGWDRAIDPWKSDAGKAGHRQRLHEEWQRLFYVAATRAKAALFLPALAPTGSWLDLIIQSGGLAAAIETPETSPRPPQSMISPTNQSAVAPVVGADQLAIRFPLPATVPAGWSHALYPEIERQSSFTALSRQLTGHDQGEDPSMGFKPAHDETPMASPEPDADIPASPLPVGAAFGVLFHQAMELVDFRLGDRSRSRDERQDQIRQFCSIEIEPAARRRSWGRGIPGWSAFAESFAELVLATLELEMPVPDAAPLPLHLAARDIMLREVAFHARIRQRGLIPGQSTSGGLSIPPGFLTGVVDLAFRHQGRWHLVDWKTNLVPDNNHQAVMDSHYYGLQALIYQASFHQFLCLQAKVSWDPLSGHGDEAAARAIFESQMGRTWYIFVRTKQAVDATNTWATLCDFQKKAGLYVS